MDADEYRRALTKLKLSQVGAANFLGVDPRTSRRWALGEAEIPKAVEIILTMMVRDRWSMHDIEAVLAGRRRAKKQP